MTLPATDTINTYGGVLQDYAPVEDPTTDMPASAGNQAFGSVAAMTHTLPRAYVVIQGDSSTPLVIEHDSVWGNTLTVLPTLTRNGTGDITITWPASVTDEIGNVQTINLKRGMSVCIEGTTPGQWTLTRIAANQVRVRIFNASGAANDFVGINFGVWVR